MQKYKATIKYKGETTYSTIYERENNTKEETKQQLVDILIEGAEIIKFVEVDEI